MNEDPKMDSLAKAIKALTIAVWCLCALVLGQLVFYGWSYVTSARWLRQTMAKSGPWVRQGPVTPPRSSLDDVSEFNRFHALPPEEMVSRATAILLVTYQDDGKRNKAVVAEILKQNPGVTLYYSVGDEFPELSFEKQKDVVCGQGQVVFMLGSAAMMASSFSINNGRIVGLGDMPLSKLREILKQNQATRRKK